ncbi:NAD-dependent epimerase/dehydratase family protein [Streptomyces sp. SCSIO 30461]|uniref:NAD-dependent epimerase/dehydratase family protein n=1 Tax=Streptomyces sp. SCSIO 30461 TaxID=3118085 RepID=UPI0030D5E2BD
MTEHPESPKYLVTGGAGFIGSHLVEALLKQGARVVVLDDLSTGRLRNLTVSREYAQRQGARDGFTFVEGSVLDAPLVDELVRDCGTVVHLAAAVGVRLIVEQPLRSFLVNTKGAESVIESASRHNRELLLASTSEIYGKNSSGPLKETSDRVLGSPAIPRWSYSTAKAVDEILAELYRREYGLRATVVRFFNTVGPRQSPAYGMVIPRFARQAVLGEPLSVYGTGEQTRCFLHVADAVDALLRLLALPGSSGETFNIGGEEEIRVLDLARRVIARAESPSSLRRLTYDEAYGPEFEDMERRVPDTSKLRDLTGWAPRRSLDDMLGDAVEQARDEVRRQALGAAAEGRSNGNTEGTGKAGKAGNADGAGDAGGAGSSPGVLAGPCPV